MRVRLKVTWGRLIAGLAGLLILGVAGTILVAWSGVYSIAASRGHPAWLNTFLEFGMQRSVEANAKDLKEPDLSDPGLIVLGASHFRAGCAPCHGAPGEPVNPIYKGMLPAPPKLREHTSKWSNNELHWIIKHGLQYAGMPGWAATDRDDEIWAMVAFLKALPDMSDEEYKALSSGNADLQIPDTGQLVAAGSSNASLIVCSVCHDTADAPPASSRVPRLGGQSRAYLLRTLTAFRTGQRKSGFMEPVATDIPEEEMEALATYFAALDSPTHERNTLAAADLDAGGHLAANGDPSRRVAACQACHDGNARPTYPRLAGQSASYLQAQLRLWRDAPPSETGYGDLMAGAVGRMTDAQIRDVSAWYASLPPRRAPTGEKAK